MRVDEPPAEPRQELLADDLHEPGGHDEVGIMGGDGRREGGVPLLAGRVILHLAHEGGDTGPLGPRETLDAVTVRAHGHDLGAVGLDTGRGDLVEQRLKIRTGTGDQHDEALGHGLGGHCGALSRGSVCTSADSRRRACAFIRMLRVPGYGEVYEAADRQQRYRHTRRPPRDGGVAGR